MADMQSRTMGKWAIAAVAMTFLLRAHAAEVAPGCGSLQNAYGPFDYRAPPKNSLALVEKHHFTPDIEFLRNKAGVAGSLDYTLRAFPNHPRALMSLVNLLVREKKERIYGMSWPIECYLIRAHAFSPDDTMVPVIYALYLMKTGKQQQAAQQLEAVKAERPNDPNVYYNLGLAYVDLGMYDKALENAHRAYALGVPLPGLKNRLVKAGKWSDAPVGESAPLSADSPRQ